MFNLIQNQSDGKSAYGRATACNVVLVNHPSLIVYFLLNAPAAPSGTVGTILLAFRVFDGIAT